MGTNIQDYVEILNAEQYVQVDKLRENARHGVSPGVRGEVWMYLLNVISPDKTNEISLILNLQTSYLALSSTLSSSLTSLLTQAALAHHTRRFFNPTYAGLISSITAETDQTPIVKTANSVHAHNQNQMQVHGHIRDASQRSKASSIGAAAGSPNIPPDHRVQPPSLQLDDGSSPEVKTLRSQYSRFLPPSPTAPPTRHGYIAVILEVLGKFYQSQLARKRDIDTRREETGLEDSEKDWIYLVTPFICCLTRPAAIYLGFEKLMERLETFPPLPSRLATLLTLFRLSLPELHSYFEDEQVPYVEVTISWLTTLLAREMWLGDILRLWDAYLASDDMFSLHCYVCVAILSTCKETLEELDGSEAKLMLLDLPPMDVDRLLQDASNLRVSFPLPRPVEDL